LPALRKIQHCFGVIVFVVVGFAGKFRFPSLASPLLWRVMVAVSGGLGEEPRLKPVPMGIGAGL